MFTGLIEHLGTIASAEELSHGRRLRVNCAGIGQELSDGASVAVNGVCLTALEISRDTFAADLSPETLERSTLSRLAEGAIINLELSATPSTHLGGHIVQGHVGGRGVFMAAESEGDFRRVRIGFPPDLARYFVIKGSVAIEGISLTIASLAADQFEIAVIPKTWEHTNLSALRPGDEVNIEVDVIAKYVERLLMFRDDTIQNSAHSGGR